MLCPFAPSGRSSDYAENHPRTTTLEEPVEMTRNEIYTYSCPLELHASELPLKPGTRSRTMHMPQERLHPGHLGDRKAISISRLSKMGISPTRGV